MLLHACYALRTSAVFHLLEASRVRDRNAARPLEGRRTGGRISKPAQGASPRTSLPAEVYRADPQSPAPCAWPWRHIQASPKPGVFSGPRGFLPWSSPSHRDTLAAPARRLPGAFLQQVFRKAGSPGGSPCCRKAVGKSSKSLPLPGDLHIHPHALPEAHCPCH